MIGVLNRTIESAPTSPKDRAIDDLTITIIKNVIKDITISKLENSILGVMLLALFIYKYFKIKALKKQKDIDVKTKIKLIS